MSDLSTHPKREHPRLDLDPQAGADDPVRARLSRAAQPGVRIFPDARVAPESHVSDYLRVIYKRRWTAITAFVVAAGSAAIYSSSATPLYTARTQLLIENENPNVVKFEEVYEPSKNTSDYYQTQYRILQSRMIARRTIESQKLWSHPMLTGVPAESTAEPSAMQSVRATVLEPVLALLPSRTTLQKGADPAEKPEQGPAMDAFLGALAVIPVRNSRLVDVTFTSPNAEFAALAVNALAKQYIEQNLEFRFLATKEATEFLNARTVEQRHALEQSEQALQAYREKTGAMAIEDRQNIVVQRLADLNAAVTRARTDRIEKESLHNQITRIHNDRTALDTFPAILNNTFIQQMKVQLNELHRQRAQLGEKLGARHPEMTKIQSAVDAAEARLNGEAQKVVQAIRNDYQGALANERALQASLNQQQAQAQEINRASAQYGVLERDAVSNQTMFAGLLQRSRETGISGELRTSNIRIVDPAEVPKSPSSPNLRQATNVGLLGGLLLGVSLAFFFEYLDSRIKDPDEVKNVLGLSFLGMVPSFKTKELVGQPLLGHSMPSDFSEAFRGIRTNLLFASASKGPKTILITSSGPDEGKSVVSANIAISLAQSSLKVLLIDGDMRRPQVHKFFGATSEPGLSNVLVGNAKPSDAVRPTRTPNLWLLPCGKLPPNPAELLGSGRFQEFIGSLHQYFDWVVIDSPPVMAVTDPGVLAHIASGVVFVVGSEMTNRWTAKTALEKLDAAQPNYLGAILNKVNVRGNPYFYSRHYRKEYQKYYTRSGA